MRIGIRGCAVRTSLYSLAAWGALSCVQQAWATAPEDATTKLLLTVEDAIQSTRVVLSPTETGPDNPQGAVSISPNKRRYVARLVRGDVKANGVWMDIITGSLESAKAASRYRRVGRLFTTGLGGGGFGIFGPANDTYSPTDTLQWLDDDRIAFMWSDAQQIRQVVLVDLRDGRIHYLTHHSTHVAFFAVGRDERVVYGAQAAPVDCATDNDVGTVFGAGIDAASVFYGDLCGGALTDRAFNTEFFIQDPGMPQPRKLVLDGRPISRDYRHRIDLAPDGRHALVNLTAGAIPTSWAAYGKRQPRGSIDIAAWIDEARQDPSHVIGRNVHRLFVLDLVTGAAKPLWDAVSVTYLAAATWSPDSRSIVLVPTYLPPTRTDPGGKSGKAAAVVNVADGSYEVLPGTFYPRPLFTTRWQGTREFTISSHGRAGNERAEFRRGSDGRWSSEKIDPQTDKYRVRMELRQDLNTPPRLVAVEASRNESVLVLDPNPELARRFDLGHREKIKGVLPSGEAWEALLFYPSHYSVGQRYPLLIQSVYSQGNPSDEFTLYGLQNGFGLGPTLIAAYPGQLMANRGVVVAHVNVTPNLEKGSSTEAVPRMKVFEALSLQLSEKGLVDAGRVGLAGFSRNGYYVEYTLTHSSFGFAAATSVDNWDPSYLAATLNGYSVPHKEMNGGEPFGDGLQHWLRQAPGFNADKVRTPLRMVDHSLGRYGVLVRWELFNRLRYLNKPVEFYLAPYPDKGTHNLQNPRQIIAVQRGSIDWFDFWLCDREDPESSKADQYARWRKLRELKLK